MAAFTSTVGWIDISSAALRTMRAELEGQEKGVLDEMGVGALHAGYADTFFPGTSVLQTRARYLLFVPWTYLWMASQRRSSPENAGALKESAEAWLISRLRETERGNGIIGGEVYPRPPVQPPDVAYWTALRTFRLYDGSASRAQLLARWDRRRILRRDDIRRGDEDLDEPPLGCFDVPGVPTWWMNKDHEVRFSLEPKEAQFLRDRLVASQPGFLLGMAASMLKKSRRPTSDRLWDDAFMLDAARALDERNGGHGERTASVVQAVERTRGASAIAEMVRAIYAALVEGQREIDLRRAGRPTPDDVFAYRNGLYDYWSGNEETTVDEAAALDLAGLAGDIHLPGDLRSLLDHVQSRLQSIKRAKQVDALLLDSSTRELFTRIERRRKRGRARLPESDGLTRREGFDARTVRVEGLDFRYQVTRRLLLDLHGGLFP
ncbi:DUF6361 family protein [Sorangium sp. So ce448]|uniref:DUF6361 family protein n=1 Tax=Sorangium sp. So ce448 TaxID=3133314 RepID=UPI003F5DD6C9